MSDLMETFEKEFSVLTAEICVKIGKIRNLNAFDKIGIIQQVERQLEEAHEILEQMGLEINGLPPEIRLKYKTRLASYQAEAGKLKKDLRISTTAFSDHTREELFGDEDSNHRADEQRALLLDNTERLEKTSRQLTSGYKVAIETETVGAEILSNLHSQRQTITRTRERLRDADHDLGKSSRILNSMIRRIVQNRFLLYFIGFVIALVIFLAIYFTIRKHT